MASGLASDRRADLARVFLGWSCDLKHTQLSAAGPACQPVPRSAASLQDLLVTAQRKPWHRRSDEKPATLSTARTSVNIEQGGRSWRPL